jgi:hypoxanthine phosphoribosyltransferase
MKILMSAISIQSRLQSLAQEIQATHKSQEVVFISVLKSAFIFSSDLIRQLTIPHKIDFIQVASYGDQKKPSGTVKLLKDIGLNIEGKLVIVVEDIVDSGITLDFILNHLRSKNPKQIEVATLLYKPESVIKKHKLDYVGFEIPNHFVVGYGMDYQEQYRNLQGIWSLDEV